MAGRPPVTDAGALVVLHKQVHLAYTVVKHLDLAVGHPGAGRGGGQRTLRVAHHNQLGL